MKINQEDIEGEASKQWWSRHCKEFSLWFLSLTSDIQVEIITSICPDIGIRKSLLENPSSAKITNLLVPELILEDLLSCDGKILILFITRRCTSKDGNWNQDLQVISGLSDAQMLPSVSTIASSNENESLVAIFRNLSDLDSPFVDPYDSEENIQCLSADTSEDTRKQLMEHFKSGRVYRADVWLWAKLRRTVILSFVVSLFQEYQRRSVVKPSPTYEALLKGEQQQLEAFDSVEIEAYD